MNTSAKLRWSLVGAVAVLAMLGCAGPPGAAGTPCTVKDNGDGSSTITCGDTTAIVKNGAAGEKGDLGVAGTNGTNGTNGANGVAGSNGTACSAVSNPDAGTTTITCGSSTYVVRDGQTGPLGPPGLGLSTGLKISVVGVSAPADAGIQVRFKVSDDRNNPVDLAGNYSINVPFAPSFSLSYISTDTATVPNVLPYNVYSKSGTATAASTTAAAPDPATVVVVPTAFTPTYPIPTGGVPATDAKMKGLLVENGTGFGDYTYTFPTGGNTQLKATSGTNKDKFVTTVVAPVAYDDTKLSSTHTIWIQARRQWDLVNVTNTRTFQAVDKEYDYVPSGAGTPMKREIVLTANCSKCHNSFKPEEATTNQFHGGGRVESPYCNVCHNPARTTNPAANSAVYVHRLHGSHKLTANPDGGTIPPNAFHDIQFAFPQDLRNCDACHAGAAQGRQAYSRPSIAACGSCHDNIDFTGATLPFCTNPAAVDADGRFIPCRHPIGPQTDANCSTCHGDATSMVPIQLSHLSILAPNANALQSAALADGGWGLPDGGAGNGNTNAAWIGAAGDVPVGAFVTTYDLKSVFLPTDGGLARPTMTFKLKQSIDGGAPVDVDFGTASSSNKELIPGFVGGPSAYFVFSVPQDGIAAPADYNASASCYIKNAWNGTATSGAGACTISPVKDSAGYYTLQMTNVVLPSNATMLTGGLGYSYAISTTRPLTQVNLGAYPYSPTTGIGGLIIAAADVSKVATGFAARRTVVETARCNNCHVQLGVGPTFHAGQRNDAQTCSFCHNPNRTSSGWAANEKDFIHSIHAGRQRTVPFNWHAISPTENFAEVEFPSNLNNCQACHAPGTYDFSAASTIAALPNMLASTAGVTTRNSSGVAQPYDSSPTTNPTGWFSISPYVISNNPANDYGVGFSYTANTGVTVQAAPTTLVKTPITAACSACHDAQDAVAHMESMGGLFYRPRTALPGAVEQCLICHGPGTIAPIEVMHK